MISVIVRRGIMTLEDMRAVDPRTVDRETLVERSTVHVDRNAPREERCRQFMAQIGNPYCYMDGKTKVKISFTATERTMDECVRSYLAGI